MSLKEMTDLSPRGDEEPCYGVAAVHALYELGMTHEAVAANWRKLAGRPVGRVRALLANLDGEKPELIQTRLTQFAKKVRPV